MLDVPKAIEGIGKSNRQLGVSVLERWKLIERGRRKFPKPEAIGVKIGLLAKGNVTWWKNQSGALDALAQLLACKADEIVPSANAQPLAVPIDAFAELAPLLPGQEACQLRDDGSWIGSVADALLHQELRSWITGPTGSGKSIARAVLRQRYGGRVTTVQCRRLVEVLPHSKVPTPLVVEVLEVDSATDEAALEELSKAASNVCVLAPFRRNVIRGTGVHRWRDVEWSPNADWRERLIKWANARVPKPQDLDVEEILGFLDGLDPQGRLFATPGDVLAVAARAYRAGLPRGASALRDLARESLGRSVSVNESAWMRTFGVEAVEALVEGRLTAVDRGVGPLRLDEWATLLPRDQAPAEPISSGAKGRLKTSDTLEKLPARQALRLLADAEVLRTTNDGRFDVASWVRAAIERERLAKELKRADLGWALLAVEPTRRGVVDDALDAASPVTLINRTRQALNADAANLDTVAAIEALFAAFARRLAGDWKPSSEMVADLQQLGLRQLELVRSLPEGRGFPGSPPLTRQSDARSPEALAAWLSEAWWFSVAVPAPVTTLDPGWILPGWSRALRLADAPDFLPLPDQNLRLLAAGRAVVRACTDETLPGKVPYALLPWVVIDGPPRGWRLSMEVLYDLLHTVGVASVVGRLLASEAIEVREQGARTAFAAGLAGMGGHALHALSFIRRCSTDLHRVVLDHLPAEDFEAALRAAPPTTGDVDALLRALPARLVRAALLALVEQTERGGGPLHDIGEVLDALGDDDLDLLLRFGAQGYGQGYAAARRVWALSPEAALARARSAMHEESRMAQVWFDTAPAEHLAALLGLMRERGSSAPSWCAPWLAGALPRAGGSAREVFVLLHSIGGKS